jgi:hypothetical protein
MRMGLISLLTSKNLPAANRLIISGFVKGHLLACKRWPFRVQFVAYWKAKGRQSQSSMFPVYFQVGACAAACHGSIKCFLELIFFELWLICIIFAS